MVGKRRGGGEEEIWWGFEEVGWRAEKMWRNYKYPIPGHFHQQEAHDLLLYRFMNRTEVYEDIYLYIMAVREASLTMTDLPIQI